MGETSGQIERHIQETRSDLRENFSELEEKVKTAVDWRAQLEERPVTMIALAFGGGVLLSALLPSRRSPRRRHSEPRWTDRNVPDLSLKSRVTPNDNASHTLETWNAFKGALVGVAATKLSGFIEDLVPGFKQEFTKAQSDKAYGPSASFTSGQPTLQRSTAPGAD